MLVQEAQDCGPSLIGSMLDLGRSAPGGRPRSDRFPFAPQRRPMLILIVVISILTTNLFLGFLVAHYLGYGPQNFQELWYGIDPRQLPGGETANRPNPIAAAHLIELAQTAAADPPLPHDHGDWETFVSQCASGANPVPSAAPLPDRELIRTVLHSNLGLQQAGLLIDSRRVLTRMNHSETTVAVPSEAASPEPPSQLPNLGRWTSGTERDVLTAWERYLQGVVLANTTPWWKSFLQQWREAQSAWLAYEATVLARQRLLDAHQQWLAKSTEVVCVDNSCRRVSKNVGTSRWWQRPSAEWRTLVWVQGQLDACERETFERLVLARQLTQRLFQQSCDWLRQTFKPALLREQAELLDKRCFPHGLEAEIHDTPKSHGSVFLIKTKPDWIADFCRGTVVSEAVVQHRSQSLNDWFHALPNLSEDGQQPLRQVLDPWTAAVWVPSAEAASARVAAWTVVDKLESALRKIDRDAVSLELRLLIVPVTPKRSSQAALKAALTWMAPLDSALWAPGANVVWTQSGRRPEPVPRPDALPRLEGELDLGTWYRTFLLGTEPLDPIDPTPADEAALPQPVEQTAPKPDNRSSADSAAPPAEDDGIDW